MNKRRQTLIFPKGSGNYWYLYWIGRIHYEKNKKVELYFINTNIADENFEDSSYGIYVQKVSVSHLVDYKIGTIYSVPDQNIIDYKSTKSHSIIALEINKILYPTSKRFPLLDNKFFPKINEPLDSELSYMKFNNFGTAVLVSPYCLAQYFFFKSDQLINEILSGTLLDHFQFDKIAIYKDKTNNRIIAELPFDQLRLKNDDAGFIAPYFFMKGNIGLKMINSLYSHLNTAFIKARTHRKNLEYYLKMDFNLSNYKIKVDGKYYYPDNDKELENKNQKIFLTHSIKSFEFSNPNIFSVDQVYLTPYNSKTSTEDRKNHDKTDTSRFFASNTEKISVLLNNDSAGRSGVLNEVITKDNAQGPFNIPVEIINRKEQNQAYDVTLIPLNEDFEGIVRQLENFSKDSRNLEENIRKEIILQESESISKFEYFEKVIDILETKDNVIINRDPFDIGLNSYPIEIKFKDHILWIDLVELKYNTSFSYIIEFGKGFIGVFNDKNKESIERNKLKNLINTFIEEDRFLEKHKVLWSKISRKYDYYLSKYDIIIQRGVEHTKQEEVKVTDGKRDKTNRFNETATRIYYERVLKMTL